MNSNPVIKPKVATPALVLISAAVLILAAYFALAMAATSPVNSFFMFGGLALLLSVVGLGTIWFVRIRGRQAWTLAAEDQWSHFENMKRSHRTTTEIVVLSVDALQPTGSWITIRWIRFNFVQQAWIEALAEPIWPGSVLLISPDPSQIRPGAPWPTMYYIHASEFLAWAPANRQVRFDSVDSFGSRLP